jgi:hypothetical protein
MSVEQNDSGGVKKRAILKQQPAMGDLPNLIIQSCRQRQWKPE